MDGDNIIGTYVGIAALERYWWGEGEFKFYLDGDEEFPTVSSTGSEDYFGGAWAFHQKDELGRPSVKNYSTLFLGYPFYETKDKTRVRFETGKLNAVHAFGDDSLPRHGLYRWHILDPIAFSEDIKVTLQQIGNDDLSLFDVRTMWQQWLIGIRILQKDLIGYFRTEEHVCEVRMPGVTAHRLTYEQ